MLSSHHAYLNHFFSFQPRCLLGRYRETQRNKAITSASELCVLACPLKLNLSQLVVPGTQPSVLWPPWLLSLISATSLQVTFVLAKWEHWTLCKTQPCLPCACSPRNTRTTSYSKLSCSLTCWGPQFHFLCSSFNAETSLPSVVTVCFGSVQQYKYLNAHTRL